MVAALLPLEAVMVAGAATTCDRAASGAPAAAVAVKVTGLPFNPGAVAVNVFAPAAVPSVQLPTVAMPPALVVRLAPVMLPPPDATATVTLPFPGATPNVTPTPGTGFPAASLTLTDGAMGTAVPASTVWLLPAFTAICVAAPARRKSAAVSALLPNEPQRPPRPV